jgi:hypothetical protein
VQEWRPDGAEASPLQASEQNTTRVQMHFIEVLEFTLTEHWAHVTADSLLLFFFLLFRRGGIMKSLKDFESVSWWNPSLLTVTFTVSLKDFESV